MIFTKEELRADPDLRVIHEMEVDPDFEPCRDERCEIEDVHRAHRIRERSARRRRTSCPRCSGAVTYVRCGEQHERATCECGWQGFMTIIGKES
jgi:hypothetical protein